MDEVEFDFSKPEALPELNSIEDFSWDSLLDNMLEVQNQQHHSCTHTHTCNPPGPDLPHDHTCLHVHTRILPAPADDSAEKCPSAKKRPCGSNKEAVRKYREKKKAHTVTLMKELIELKMINQQLMKRLENQAALQAEVNRLKCLLVDVKGRIEGEIGSFPYQRHAKAADGDAFPSGAAHANAISGARVLNSCGFHCDEQVHCFGPGMQTKSRGENSSFSGQEFGASYFANVQCMGDSISGSVEVLDCEGGSGSSIPVNCLSNAKK